ncbi:MAG: GLPGLI family protein [Bacteroidia bacterium]|nr:GLPGLI family protein [Bacteroidia bacterium]
MSKIYALFLLFLPLALIGQNNSGYVTFEEKINLHKQLKTDDPDLMKMIPEFKTDQKILLFSPEACLYRSPLKEDKDMEVEKSTDDGEMKMVIKSSKNELFRDLKTSKTIEQKEFMTRTFLIEGELPKKNWKITGKQETIAGFLCMEAVLDDTSKTTAWFTPQIPVSAGPGVYGDLPGLILKVSVNDDTQLWVAQKVELKAIDSSKFVAPTQGKKVSREKFKEIVEEKMKEMQEASGGGGMIKIIKN